MSHWSANAITALPSGATASARLAPGAFGTGSELSQLSLPAGFVVVLGVAVTVPWVHSTVTSPEAPTSRSSRPALPTAWSMLAGALQSPPTGLCAQRM